MTVSHNWREGPHKRVIETNRNWKLISRLANVTQSSSQDCEGQPFCHAFDDPSLLCILFQLSAQMSSGCSSGRAVGYQVRGTGFKSQSGPNQFFIAPRVHPALNG
ncbi:hypothetical protein PoB_001267100 [Plakobranchus ocellatus]|uniref:Uncharacterized protein n=1 Tax=Plakobranchus ocellatus TaxID=259542 RepID=A0AAV3YFR8_9GAST|nr:hypothetical protein PoB_001267100 [Plakobranchus ocellatus]